MPTKQAILGVFCSTPSSRSRCDDPARVEHVEAAVDEGTGAPVAPSERVVDGSRIEATPTVQALRIPAVGTRHRAVGP